MKHPRPVADAAAPGRGRKPPELVQLAAVYRMAGRHDDAVATLHALFAAPGLVSARQLHADPDWAPLRRHPRFSAAP